VAPSPPIASADALRRPGIHLVLSTGDRWPGAAHLLTTAERARADAFRHEQSRGEFVVGRALVRRLVAAATGLPAREIPIVQDCLRCGSDRHGKPRVGVVGAPQFSVSHSGGWVLVGVSQDGALGVDIETVSDRPSLLDLAPSILSATESEVLASLPRTEAGSEATRLRWFTTRWCLKEAVVKRDGDGLAREMRDVEVSAETVVPLDAPELPIAVVGAVAGHPPLGPLSWWSVPAD